MKRLFVFGIAMAVIMLLGIVSCTGGLSESSLEVKSDVFSSLTAFTENGLLTKTGLVDNGTGGRSVVWRPGDAISVFFNNGYGGGVKYTTTSSGPKATFTGDFKGTRGDAWYWGIYPYDSNASCSCTSVSTQLLPAQIAYSGDVADNLLVTVGRSKDQSFYFKNTCAVIGFTLSQEGISKITFKGNDDEPVSGGFAASFDTNEEIVIIPNEDASKTVEITPGEGLEFETGSQYYFAIFPGEYNSGYTLSFERNDGTVASYSRTTPFTFARSMFYTMTNKDEGLTFSPANPEVEYNFLEVFYGEANCKIAYNVSSTTIDVTPYLTGPHFTRTENRAYPDMTQAPAKAYLIWRENTLTLNVAESVSDNVIEISGVQGTGNAVIGVYNIARQLLWSYHLWVPGFDPEADYLVINGKTMMRAAIGATAAWPSSAPQSLDYSAAGLFYQWGRKDPLGRLRAVKTLTEMTTGNALGAEDPSVGYIDARDAIATIPTDEEMGIESELSKVIKYSFLNPAKFIFYTSYSTYTTFGEVYDCLWGHDGTTNFGKTIFDPSPKGWRVPDFSLYGTESIPSKTISRVANYPTANPTDIWLHFGQRIVGGFTTTSGAGFFWTNVPFSGSGRSSYFMSAQDNSQINPAAGGANANNADRSYAKLIRCVAE